MRHVACAMWHIRLRWRFPSRLSLWEVLAMGSVRCEIDTERHVNGDVDSTRNQLQSDTITI